MKITPKNNHPKRIQKEQLFILFAQTAAALANPHRLEILDLLLQAPRTVEELAQDSAMSVANTSQHLQKLKRARLVVDERLGLYVWYRLASPEVASLWLNVRDIGRLQLAEVEKALDAFRNRRHEFKTITPDELLSQMKTDEVILLDVRPANEYQFAHLPGAVSIPLQDLPDRIHELTGDKTIVAYCRGPYCLLADWALEQLSSQGWNVARLEEGVAEWRAAGYPLENHPIPQQ